MTLAKPRLMFFVTVDWFFCSHFLGRAVAARNAGYEVLVLTDVDRHGEIIRNAGLRLLPLSINRGSVNPFSALMALLKILRVYHREKPDIIHQVAIKPILLGSLAASILGCQRVVNAVVGGGYAFTSDSYLARILRPFLTLCLKFVLKRPGSKVVFENVDDLDSFAVSGLARREDSVLIRGAGVDPSQFQVGDKKFRVPIVVLVARLLWDKGIGEFVEAARILRLRGAKARFVIVGDPDFDNRACINSMTLEAWKTEGVVELWGFRSDIADVLTEANIACLPSYREGLPKSLLEAMAAGLPCITTDVPGCREAVRDGDNGLLVPAKDASALANAIEHLLLNPDVAQIMGTRGRERLEEEFSSRQVHEKTLTLYRELMSK